MRYRSDLAYVITIYRNCSWAIQTAWFMWLLARLRLVLLRVHKKKLYVPPASGTVGGGRRGGEGTTCMKKLGTIGMLIRFARFLGCFVLFCECRSSADGVVECVPRSSRACAGERIKTRWIMSIPHSRFHIGSTPKVTLYNYAFHPFLYSKSVRLAWIFIRLDCRWNRFTETGFV